MVEISQSAASASVAIPATDFYIKRITHDRLGTFPKNNRKQMATRSRTLLYLNFRNSFVRTGKKSKIPDVDASENAGLMANHDEVVVEMNVLPPRWFD